MSSHMDKHFLKKYVLCVWGKYHFGNYTYLIFVFVGINKRL